MHRETKEKVNETLLDICCVYALVFDWLCIDEED